MFFLRFVPFLIRKFVNILFITWVTSSLIFIFIGTGSITLVKDKLQLITTGLAYSLTIPLLVITRLIIGWSYIHKRLINQIVVYEESDWHDGQKWRKTPESLEKDIIIAKYEVIPIINLLRYSLILGIIILSLGFIALFFSFYK